jgi:hypothetical protein
MSSPHGSAIRPAVNSAFLFLLASAIGCSDRSPVVPESGATIGASAATAVTVPVEVKVVPAGGEGRCAGVTVLARNRDLDKHDFHVRLSDSSCVASFDLPLGEAYVFSIRNTLVARFEVWPNVILGPGSTDPTLPARLGTVCVEASAGAPCSSEILTPASYQTARLAATPLTGPRTLELQYRFTGRVIPCTAPGAVGSANAHAMIPLPPGYTIPGRPPPALGLWIGAVGEATDCVLKSIPDGELVVVEAIDETGTVFRGLIGRHSSAPLQLEADPDFFRVDYIVDDPDDNPGGRDDLGLTRFGLLRSPLSPGSPGETLLMRMSLRKVPATGNTQVNLVIREITGIAGQVLLPHSVQVRIRCSRQRGGCWAGEISPSSAASLVRVSGVIAPDGDGYADVRINFTGVSSARFRARAGAAGGFDDAPDVGVEPKLWEFPGSGNSFTVSF